MVLAFVFNTYVRFCECFAKDPDRVMFLPFGLVLKFSSVSGVGAEGDTLRFIRKHTTIPVPRVIASARGYGRTYTLMTRVDGELLEDAWVDLTSEQRSRIVDQLRQYVRQLRMLAPPSSIPAGAVCSLYYEGTLDSRIASAKPNGPHPNEAAFNDHLIKVAERFMGPVPLPGIRARMRDDHRIMFTHGDLTPRNIIVKGDKVTAIIDWEESGWYPEHWEFVKALWCPGLRDDEWQKAVRGFISPDSDCERDYMVDCELSDNMVGAF